jgi:hypothetical protein
MKRKKTEEQKNEQLERIAEKAKTKASIHRAFILIMKLAKPKIFNLKD